VTVKRRLHGFTQLQELRLPVFGQPPLRVTAVQSVKGRKDGAALRKAFHATRPWRFSVGASHEALPRVIAL
jgi:hypothetical protein